MTAATAMKSFIAAMLLAGVAAAANTNHTTVWTHPMPAPTPASCVVPTNTPYAISGSNWLFRHHPTRFGVFTFTAEEHCVEHVPDEPIVIQTSANSVATICTTQAEMNVRAPTRIHNRLETTIHLLDANGRTWTIRRTFRPENQGRELLICTDIIYDPHHDDPEDARILHVPYLTLLANRHSAGHKRQALLAGIEYLGDENSSSSRDLVTGESDRRIPADFRFTAPLAVITSRHRWLSAQWSPGDPARAERFATIFDSPDRVYNSNGHLLAFWAPAVGSTHSGQMLDARFGRVESSFAISHATRFRQGRHTIRLRTGQGGFVTDAVDQLISPSDLPDPTPLPAPDTLTQLANEGRDILIHTPARIPAVQLLLSTNFVSTLDALVRTNQAISPDPLDLSAPSTPSTCGELAHQLLSPLTTATWIGDEAYIARVLATLDRVTALSRGNVPRGGHPGQLSTSTPDMQAAIDLAACYTDAYLLCPRESYLREANRWATAALAFVRLDGSIPIGAYTATAALGMPMVAGSTRDGTETSWIGNPRTAEALAYATVLLQLARIEPTRRRTNYWRAIASGITRTAILQRYPDNDPICSGLLPTSWDLIRQTRKGTPRDPFALQVLAAEQQGIPFVSCRALPFTPQRPSILHLPGSITPARKFQQSMTCQISCWPATPCRLMITRFHQPGKVTLNGQPLSVDFIASRHVLVVSLPPRAKGSLMIVP